MKKDFFYYLVNGFVSGFYRYKTPHASYHQSKHLKDNGLMKNNKQIINNCSNFFLSNDLTE